MRTALVLVSIATPNSSPARAQLAQASVRRVARMTPQMATVEVSAAMMSA